MSIFLVRHGQDEDNVNNIFNGHRNSNLTDLGKKQAEQAGIKLADKQIKAIISSPLIRAQQTAQIISHQLRINRIQVNDLLIERDFGVLTGKKVSEVSLYTEKFLKTDITTYLLGGEGVETLLQTLERAKQVLKDMTTQYSNSNILLVTHQQIAQMIEAAFYGWTINEALQAPPLDNGEIIELKKKQ